MVHSIFPQQSRGAYAPPGTPAGDQLRDAFLADLLEILGDVRMLWLPTTAETTTSTDRSRHAATLTYDATVVSRYSPLGSGWALEFDGTDDEADTPDNDRLSFGNGASDEPFSIVALVNPDTVNANRNILSKYDLTTGNTKREWYFLMRSDGAPDFILFDESAAGSIGRGGATALTAATWTLLCAAYDGSGAETGIAMYKDGVLVDDTSRSSGSYTAMGNTASLVRLGFYQDTSSGSRFWDGKMAFVALTGKALSAAENWSVKKLVNGFYDLAL